MADIKFMDLSENDNPATTDSVLIGNESNGLKRTSLANIANLIKVAGPVVHLETVEAVSNPSATDSNAKLSIPVQAPAVAGYTFAFWLSPATNGTDRPTYVEGSAVPSTRVWIYYSPSEINTSVDPVKIDIEAVYVKSELM